ncbi:uncharacterized protein SETTUDRAFT_47563 [Exserohilum turcica Et28A]|uniref:RhoGAP-domain-containing protein n=1 Tax=Exserohilum turcicum (strain 28A) TaxID=671987 RepID=R0KDH7_EXST2|nr:uncharacterized protein SETTUDRAFT_47563 [Exserohilum turcica Et28A]EOA86207.1 hypothetical protein SETTUDRAFT_47563 [Exserohilum turcica Et28A]
MDSPGAYPESPIDDEIVYPCKGCGEILEEGKAFELAGNRWHIDCFRCNTCGTLLDSDANLLLLGDGSLICNNCTYSCNHCGNKIEDLAILTGDQAFCANCFRCRNCKRKIENLRYARTSQGIFCMSCHESLMARRRKKSKKPPSIAPKVDKSLPALPPQEPSTTSSSFTPDIDTPSDAFSEPPTTDVSPRPPHPKRGDSSSNFRRDVSPAPESARRDNTTLPATTYGKDTARSDPADAADDGILLPFALDPNPAPGPSPLGRPASRINERTPGAKPAGNGEAKNGRDYFNRPTADHRELLKENGSRDASRERKSTQPNQSQSPHIAFQEKERQPSDTIVDTLKKKDGVNESPSAEPRSRSQHATPTSASAAEPFKLQDVPKGKKADAKRKESDDGSPLQSQQQQRSVSSNMISNRLSRPVMESAFTSSPPLGSSDSPDSSESSFGSSAVVERPARGDSLNPGSLKPPVSLSHHDRPDGSPTTPTMSHPERSSSAAAATAQLNAGLGITAPMDPQSAKSLSDVPVLPARSGGRPPPPPTAESFTSPRAPPLPPGSQVHKPNESLGSAHSEASRDASTPGGLPRYSHQGDFSMDEDFARLLGSQDGRDDKDSGVLRRVSNAVSKHGRSFSDRSSVTSRGGHKKWPTNGSIDISSPTVASPDTKEEGANLRNELRRAQQRIAELETEKNGLQESMHSAADIKQANTVLREKRNTMAVLDTQREMVIRELEIMTEHLKRAKSSQGSMDIGQLKSDILKDFGISLQKLKDNLGHQIEDLITKRSELTEEISNLIQMKDKGFQEYESLTAANARLSAMNRDLVDNIQTNLKNNKKGGQTTETAPNGLGIYNAQQKGGKSEVSVEAPSIPHDHSYANIHETEAEATVAQPQVVNIRKTGKPTKFSTWKKGSQAITKNVTKGFKGAFGSDQKQDDYNTIKVIGTPYGSVHQQPDFASMSSMSSSIKSREQDQNAQRGWFSNKPTNTRPGQTQYRPMQHNESNINLAADASTVLFGSDLTARCEFEKQMIPRIVSRCIEEVELRGMDVEGIYRKSGGTSQVNQVRKGFETDSEHDISDPDLDIHSITSALKNYFRRLPVPLITFDVYDQFLEAGQLEEPAAQVKALSAAVGEIPKAHRDTLQFLVFHLSRVIQHQSDNLMTPLNVAVVFAPTIMRPMDIQRELTDVQAQRVAVQALLENYKAVFGDE